MLRHYFVAVIALLLVACSNDVNGMPEPKRFPEPTIEAAQGIIASYGCGSCHTISWVPGADGTAAPPLIHFYERSYIAGRLANTQDNLITWIQDPQKVEPGTAMPTLGVSADEAKAIAEYLYHKPTIQNVIDP